MSTHYTHLDNTQLSLVGAGTAADHSVLAALTDFDTVAASMAAKLSGSATTGIVTVSEAGYYRLDFNGAFLGTTAKSIIAAFYRNATVVGGSAKTLYALTGVLLPLVSLSSTIWCEPNDELTVQVIASDATNWTPTDLSFTVTRVG